MLKRTAIFLCLCVHALVPSTLYTGGFTVFPLFSDADEYAHAIGISYQGHNPLRKDCFKYGAPIPNFKQLRPVRLGRLHGSKIRCMGIAHSSMIWELH